MAVDRTYSESPVAYRLARKPDGEMVLQSGWGWADMDDDLSSTQGIEWRIEPTVQLHEGQGVLQAAGG